MVTDILAKDFPVHHSPGIEHKDGTEKRNFLFYTADAQSPAFNTNTSFFKTAFLGLPTKNKNKTNK